MAEPEPSRKRRKKDVELVEMGVAPNADVEELTGIGKVTGQKLKGRGYYAVRDLAFSSAKEIAAIIDDKNKAIELVKIARSAMGLSKNFKLALETHKKRMAMKRISTGVRSLDDLLYGGIEMGAITELAGEYGAGKTQLCHQLAVTVQLPEDGGGLNAKAIYIDTENAFRTERIIQIARARGLDPNRALEGIYHARAYSSDHQIELVEQARQLMQDGARLLIVDSLIAHFRAEYPGRDNLTERQQRLNKHIADLLKIAEAYEAAVVVTNQIISTPEAVYHRPHLRASGGAPAMPAGGNVLAHGATYRIWLRKGRENIRVAKIFDSSYHPEGEAVFKIIEEGVADA